MLINQYILTVAIATKNRQSYCIETIKSILDLDVDKKIQIAIADNSDSNEIQVFVRNYNDDRINYHYTNAPMTNTDNYNMALSLAQGKYVTCIGDDDGLLPNIFEMLNWACDNNIGSFSSRNCVIYYWPGSIDAYPNGHLILPISFDLIESIDVEKELQSFLKNGLQHYLNFSLPKLYHGFIRRDIIENVKKITGHYIGGLSTDIYACISISAITKVHHIINSPLTIAGVCAKSTTADLFTGKHRGELSSMPHLANRKNYKWSKLVPEYYSPNTIWAETAIKALEETNNTILIDKHFNPYYLLAQGFVNNRKDILKLLMIKSLEYNQKTLKAGWFNFVRKIFFCLFLIVIKKFKTSILKWTVFKETHINNVVDIHLAVKISRSTYIK
jgi:glycosyltransferase involved in cell wall biosynthesis